MIVKIARSVNLKLMIVENVFSEFQTFRVTMLGTKESFALLLMVQTFVRIETSKKIFSH